MKSVTLCCSALLIALAGACSSPKPMKTTVNKINRMSASDMQQLSQIGNVWISEQPTEKDLRWFRDNYVMFVMDTRTREEDRGFDERAYVVSLGMKYRLESLAPEEDFTVEYFDRIRSTLYARRDVPTLIHGETADRAAAAWLPYRILDENVPYPQALAEARIAGLENDKTLRIVQQYLLRKGVDIKDDTMVDITAEDGPDETIFHIEEHKTDQADDPAVRE